MQKRLIERAVRIAKRNNTPEKHPRYGTYVHFTFIVQNGVIVDWGVNRNGKSVYSVLGYSAIAMIHSENDAYRKAKGLLDPSKSFSAINIRLNRQNELRLAAPCPCCRNFLTIMGCKEVYFSDKGAFVKARLKA